MALVDFFLAAEMAFAGIHEIFEVFWDERICQTGPGCEVAAIDGAKEVWQDGTKNCAMEERCKFGFFLVRSDGAVHTLYVGTSLSGGNSTWWGKWDVPKAIGFVTVASDDDISFFYNDDVVFFEYYGTVVIVELADGD